MDKADRKLLGLLLADGRISWKALAEQVNLSASACQRRVEALIAAGVVDRFTLRVNDARLGNGVKAFVEVNVERQDAGAAGNFRRVIEEHPKVQSCHMLSGSIDYLLEVVARDLDDFAGFIESLLALPGVRDARSSIALKVIKPYTPVIE